jgi:hypothetical protein
LSRIAATSTAAVGALVAPPAAGALPPLVAPPDAGALAEGGNGVALAAWLPKIALMILPKMLMDHSLVSGLSRKSRKPRV